MKNVYINYNFNITLPKILHADPVNPEIQLHITLESEPIEQLSSLELHGHLVHCSLVSL